MSRYKSLLKNTAFDTAGKAHDCRANRRHRILKGECRLRVKEGRKLSYYCLDCARKILERDLSVVHRLVEELEAS